LEIVEIGELPLFNEDLFTVNARGTQLWCSGLARTTLGDLHV
jgi:hypothetical protein